MFVMSGPQDMPNPFKNPGPCALFFVRHPTGPKNYVALGFYPAPPGAVGMVCNTLVLSLCCGCIDATILLNVFRIGHTGNVAYVS